MTLRHNYRCDLCDAQSVTENGDGDGLPPGWYAIGVTRPVTEADGENTHYRRDIDACSPACYRRAMASLAADPAGDTFAVEPTQITATTTKGN